MIPHAKLGSPGIVFPTSLSSPVLFIHTCAPLSSVSITPPNGAILLYSNQHKMAGERGASSSSPSLWAVPLSPMEEDEGDGPVSAAALFAQLDVDALRHLTALLPAAALLSLAAVSHDMAQTFCPAVVRLAVSKVSLRGCALQPALLALCKRYPMLTDLDLTRSGAVDADVALVGTSFPQLTRLSLAMCDDVSNAAMAEVARSLPSSSRSTSSAAATSTTTASALVGGCRNLPRSCSGGAISPTWRCGCSARSGAG